MRASGGEGALGRAGPTDTLRWGAGAWLQMRPLSAALQQGHAAKAALLTLQDVSRHAAVAPAIHAHTHRLSHDADTEVAQNAIVALGIMGAGGWGQVAAATRKAVLLCWWALPLPWLGAPGLASRPLLLPSAFIMQASEPRGARPLASRGAAPASRPGLLANRPPMAAACLHNTAGCRLHPTPPPASPCSSRSLQLQLPPHVYRCKCP